MNDSGQLVGRGTGGALLLTPIGPMPPPPAPSALTAVPHEATWTQPWNSIFLEWSDNTTTEEHFRIERRDSGTATWIGIKETINRSYHDSAVDLGVMYDYPGLRRRSRRRLGALQHRHGDRPGNRPRHSATHRRHPEAQLGGDGLGQGQITVAVADNRGVEFLEVETRINSSDVLICRMDVRGAASSTETCTWNTRGVPLGRYVLEAWDYDALGNYASDSVSVELVAKRKGKPGR
jgi:hypothetical protein